MAELLLGFKDLILSGNVSLSKVDLKNHESSVSAARLHVFRNTHFLLFGLNF